MKGSPQGVRRSMFSVVQLLQSWNGQEFFHRHPIFQQQLDKVDAIMFERLHHCIVQCAMLPFLAVHKDLRSRNVHAIPSQRKAKLFGWTEVLRFEQSGEYSLVELLCIAFGFLLDAIDGDLNG